MSTLSYSIYGHTLSSREQVRLFEIAAQMKAAGLDDELIAAGIRAAWASEQVVELLHAWVAAADQEQLCQELLTRLEEYLGRAHHTKAKFAQLKMNDLKAISRHVREFKDALLETVMQQGGVKALAERTGIPQPSLSRFFNSEAIPRRSTLLKIAKALNIESVRIGGRGDDKA